MPKNWPYFLPSEVIVHNKPDDIWVSCLGCVYDYTPLVKEYRKKKCIKPLLVFAGKDISHWFDKRTKDIKHIIHPVTGVKVPFCPLGRLPHMLPHVPTVRWKPLEAQMRPIDGKPWWLDKRYMVGYLTKKARPLRVINVLAPHTHRNNLIWVASEERLEQILERIIPHNTHGKSYTFKFEGRVLHMNKTLDENDIFDERERFLEIGMTDDYYIPAVKLYYNDDLTV